MKIEVFKRTEDDWFGSYHIEDDARVDKLVEVKFTQTGPNPPAKGLWRVCVWGNDDFGMEQDYINETEALHMFYQVISWDFVNINRLKNTGFIYQHEQEHPRNGRPKFRDCDHQQRRRMPRFQQRKVR